MALEKWAEAIAIRLQEQAAQLSNNDICKGLSDCLNDLYPGAYAYICDVFGDDESGDVVYYQGGDYHKSSYSMGFVNGKRTHNIDTENAVNVLPRTVYDEEADDDDHMIHQDGAPLEEDSADLEDGAVMERFPGSKGWKVPFRERFISKSERDNADSSDFAGKGKSYPILKPPDIPAAVRSMGRAGPGNKSTAALKASIIRIAKRKGWTKYLPKAWQAGGDDQSEATREVDITGDVITLREGAVAADGTAMLKLIAPGWGSSGYYSADVLKRDGPKVFPAGTRNFWNHPTAAEESARPEGDLDNLASKLVEPAHYVENGPAGPGLYAKAQVYEHFRKPVNELAKDIGMSIRAAGKAREGKAEGRSGPIIEELSRGVSVDYVTSPGAGGKILQLFEAARGRTIPTQGDDMDEAAVKKLIKEATDAATAPLLAKLAEYEKPSVKPKKAIRRMLESIRLPDPAKEEVVRNLKSQVPLTESGAIDEAKLKPMVEAEAKRQAQLLEKLGLGGVQGLGTPINPQEAQITQPKPEELLKESEDIFARLMDDKEAAKIAARGRAA